MEGLTNEETMDNNRIEEEVYARIIRFCDYRERSISEVAKKLTTLGVRSSMIDYYLSALMEDDYVNQTRYLESYVQGKFRIKFWGRKKIYHKLRAQGIPSEDINKALRCIDEEEYLEKARELIGHHLTKASVQGLEQKQRTYRYMLQKGFETYIVYPMIYKRA